MKIFSLGIFLYYLFCGVKTKLFYSWDYRDFCDPDYFDKAWIKHISENTWQLQSVYSTSSFIRPSINRLLD